jgi:cell division protein FtsL
MTRLNLVLLLVLIASGLYLVSSSHRARQLFADLNRLQNEQRRLDNDHQRLITERQIAATNLRVEQMAREKLQMRMPTPAVTQYVTDGPLPASAAASGAVP